VYLEHSGTALAYQIILKSDSQDETPSDITDGNNRMITFLKQGFKKKQIIL